MHSLAVPAYSLSIQGARMRRLESFGKCPRVLPLLPPDLSSPGLILDAPLVPRCKLHQLRLPSVQHMASWKFGNEAKMKYIRIVRFANQYVLLFTSFRKLVSHIWIPRSQHFTFIGPSTRNSKPTPKFVNHGPFRLLELMPGISEGICDYG